MAAHPRNPEPGARAGRVDCPVRLEATAMSATTRALGATALLVILAACSSRGHQDVVYVETDPHVQHDSEYRKY